MTHHANRPDSTIPRLWSWLGERVKSYVDLRFWHVGWMVDVWVLLRFAVLLGILLIEDASPSDLLARVGAVVGALFVVDIVLYQLSTALAGILSSSGLRLLTLSMISYLTIGLAFTQLYLVQRDALVGNPGAFDVAFFSFVTLSTIGFGEVHPRLNEPLVQLTVVVEHLVALFFVAVALVVVIGIIRARDE